MIGRVYAGQTAADREAACRARLREAIHGIVGSNGYAALTVERACARANVSSTDLAGVLIGGHRIEDR